MASRPVEVVATEPGSPPWTDGTTVHLDPTTAHLDQVRALTVQASLLAAGSLTQEVVGAMGGRRRTARRYLAVEGHRALLANEYFLPGAAADLIDRATAARSGSPEESLELALGRDPLPDPPPEFGELHRRAVLDTLADVGDGAPAGSTAATTGDLTESRALPDIDEEDDPDDAEYLGQLLTSPVGGGGPIGRLLQRLLTSTRQRSGGGGPPGADAATHSGRGVRQGAAVFVSRGEVPAESGDLDPVRTELSYPEWDVNRRQYRPQWCTVTESSPPPDALVAMPMPDGAALRRPLARLGTGLVACRRRPQGDDIDIDAVVEARVDARAGVPVTDGVYVESVRARRDLSVQILLDISGSAGEPGPGGRPVHEHQRRVAAELTAALAGLGDRVALHAFNSQGRTSVRITRVKDFDDRLDGRVARRLGGLEPSGYTRMGAAIRHGTASVEDRGGTPHRLLVVISDGFAYDHGYEGRYGESDARRALTEARRRGVGCLCLSVGAGRDAAALRRVFGTAAHASVTVPEQLVGRIGPLFRASMLSAETRRRRFQRRQRTSDRLGVEHRTPEGSER